MPEPDISEHIALTRGKIQVAIAQLNHETKLIEKRLDMLQEKQNQILSWLDYVTQCFNRLLDESF